MKITSNSTADEMIAELLGLKAAQLGGQLPYKVFKVKCLHVIWCSTQAGKGIADEVARRVNTVTTGEQTHVQT